LIHITFSILKRVTRYSPPVTRKRRDNIDGIGKENLQLAVGNASRPAHTELLPSPVQEVITKHSDEFPISLMQ